MRLIRGELTGSFRQIGVAVLFIIAAARFYFLLFPSVYNEGYTKSYQVIGNLEIIIFMASGIFFFCLFNSYYFF